MESIERFYMKVEDIDMATMQPNGRPRYFTFTTGELDMLTGLKSLREKSQQADVIWNATHNWHTVKNSNGGGEVDLTETEKAEIILSAQEIG